MVFTTHNAAETEHLGEQLAAELQPGDVIAFSGGLGMGKTAFTRGLALGLGVEYAVTSPTYTIVNEYQGRMPLFHFDLYRLSCYEELEDIGWEDYLSRGGLCCLEWSENVPEVREGAIVVSIERGAEDDQRIIKIERN